ncbi:MAG: homocysteine S-methyltransferase family protein [Candidatus Levyibacteriota bacterium]
MKNKILQKLKKGTVLVGEGYLFELERRGYVKAGAFVPEVVLDFPDAVRELHREFLRAGSDVMVAFTYYAHRDKLRVIGRENDLEPMNRQALRIANEIAKEGDAIVAGNISNTWVYDPNDKDRSAKLVYNMFDEQVRWAVEEGVDFIIAETIEYVEEAKIATEVIKKYNLPAVITLGATYDKSKDNYDWIEGCKIVEASGADVVGFNCIRGPQTMMPLLEKLRKNVKIYTAALPVTYATTEEYPAFQFLRYDRKKKYPMYMELDKFLLSRYEMAEFAKQAEELGINYIGVCCGGAPHQVRAIAEALGRIVPASKYSPDMSKHGLLGDETVVNEHEKEFLKMWK